MANTVTATPAPAAAMAWTKRWRSVELAEQPTQELPAVATAASDDELIVTLASQLGARVAIGTIASILGAGVDIAEAAVKALLELDGIRALIKLGDAPALAPSPVRAQHQQNLIRRATYLINAARRLTTAVVGPVPTSRAERLQAALAREKAYLHQHVEAVNNRNAAALEVSRQYAAENMRRNNRAGLSDFGPTLLGWYAVMDERTSNECRRANGRNFDPMRIPSIGYPGAVHPHCRCKPGPPHRTNSLVDGAQPQSEVAMSSGYIGRHRRPDPDPTVVIDLVNGKPPYQWRHGWVPLTPDARAIKDKRKSGSAHDSPGNLSVAKTIANPRIGEKRLTREVSKIDYGEHGSVAHRTYPKRWIDSEELYHAVAREYDAPVPEFHRINPTESAVRWVPGHNQDILNPNKGSIEDQRRAVESEAGKKIALLDFATNQVDRQAKNWMLTADGDPVAIDNVVSFKEDGSYKHLNVFERYWLPESGPARVTQADIDQLREAWERTEPEFKRMKKMSWYRQGLARIDRLEPAPIKSPRRRKAVEMSQIDLVSSAAYPDLERVPGKQNWVDKAGGLPDYIERIAKHLHYEQGMSISRAIATAVNTVKKWAAGGDNVKPETRAKAARAVAQWEAKKASSRS